MWEGGRALRGRKRGREVEPPLGPPSVDGTIIIIIICKC